jgi:phenylpropionate dioxygenase-like ring-hydroxylating dioxygenase large terminal subunit
MLRWPCTSWDFQSIDHQFEAFIKPMEERMNVDPRIADRPRGHAKAMISGGFLRNAWYVAMWGEDLARGQLVGRTILGEPLAIFRKQDGSVAALADSCPHRFAPLHIGKVLSGDRIQCAYHGLEFDGSGACVHNPHGNRQIARRARVRSYPVVERHRAVWVWMGDKPADPAAIPDFNVLDTPNESHVAKLDWITIAANYELVMDNLLDLSHVSYLHDGLLGNQDTVDSEITVEQDGDAVVVGRRSSNSAIPGLFAIQLPSEMPRVDKWNTIRWTAPGCMLLKSGVCQPGTDPQGGTGYYGIHFLTPETARTTRYHFTAVRWNVLTKDEALNQQIREKISVMRRFAFEKQDAPVIEAQQASIDRADESLDPVLLSIDVGPVRYKRILERLIAQEQA